MIKITDKNRDQIIEDYVDVLIEGMDFDALYAFAYEQLLENKNLMDNNSLEIEINNYFPDLLQS